MNLIPEHMKEQLRDSLASTGTPSEDDVLQRTIKEANNHLATLSMEAKTETYDASGNVKEQNTQTVYISPSDISMMERSPDPVSEDYFNIGDKSPFGWGRRVANSVKERQPNRTKAILKDRKKNKAAKASRRANRG